MAHLVEVVVGHYKGRVGLGVGPQIHFLPILGDIDIELKDHLSLGLVKQVQLIDCVAFLNRFGGQSSFHEGFHESEDFF